MAITLIDASLPPNSELISNGASRIRETRVKLNEVITELNDQDTRLTDAESDIDALETAVGGLTALTQEKHFVAKTGTGTFVVPAGVVGNKLYVTCVGGGGGAGGANSTGTPLPGGDGLNGQVRQRVLDVTPAQNIPYSVGAGGLTGNDGVAPVAFATPGGDTTFGTVFAIGGPEGNFAAPGQPTAKVNDATGLSTLAGALSNSATAFSVAIGTGASFPSTAGGAYFYVEITDGTLTEVVKVTSRTADAFNTVVRGQFNSTALAWASGVVVRGVTTKNDGWDGFKSEFGQGGVEDHNSYFRVGNMQEDGTNGYIHVKWFE